ncbi:hypothetical protein J6590_064999 [Homalodisca vitripennis]|nr:hypothetical protein J6590_064999 [Homalodisca vitripennis]
MMGPPSIEIREEEFRAVISRHVPLKGVEASSEPASPVEKDRGLGRPYIKARKTVRVRTLPTLTVISRNIIDLSNYPCTRESQHLWLIMCRFWKSIR